jgi:hypothetical protein
MPRIPTLELRNAILTGCGPLFDAVVEVVYKMNPNLSPNDLANGLLDLLGPRTPADVFDPPTRIRFFPTEVIVDGVRVPVLESHPLAYLICITSIGALRKAVWDRFGGPEGYAKIRAAYAAEGGTVEDFDAHFVSEMRRAREEGIERARLKSAKADADEKADAAKRRGCAGQTLAIALAALAVWMLVCHG